MLFICLHEETTLLFMRKPILRWRNPFPFPGKEPDKDQRTQPSSKPKEVIYSRHFTKSQRRKKHINNQLDAPPFPPFHQGSLISIFPWKLALGISRPAMELCVISMVLSAVHPSSKSLLMTESQVQPHTPPAGGEALAPPVLKSTKDRGLMALESLGSLEEKAGEELAPFWVSWLG